MINSKVVGLRRKRCPVTLDCDGMGSIPAFPETLNVPLLLCHELFNEASLPEVIDVTIKNIVIKMTG